MEITATEFQQNIGRYQDEALKKPLKITKNGRPHMVLMSNDFFEAVIKGKIARKVEDLDDAALKAIASAEVPRAHKDGRRRPRR